MSEEPFAPQSQQHEQAFVAPQGQSQRVEPSLGESCGKLPWKTILRVLGFCCGAAVVVVGIFALISFTGW